MGGNIPPRAPIRCVRGKRGRAFGHDRLIGGLPVQFAGTLPFRRLQATVELISRLFRPGLFSRMHYLRCVRPRFRGFSTANVNSTQDLAGTVPFHDYYVLLHSRNPPREFPRVVSSPVKNALQLTLTPLNGLVNFSWSPQHSPPPLLSPSDEEAYSATSFSKWGSIVELEELTLSNVQDAVQRITAPRPTVVRGDAVGPLHIYICTHAARDCRCGDVGGLVAEAFRKEIGRRGLTSVVKLGETGHVGGHKSSSLNSYLHKKYN